MLEEEEGEIMTESDRKGDSEKGLPENEGAHNVNRRAVVKNSAYLWPNGVVPYVLDKSLSK